MTDKIGVGLIGCGGIARMKHLPALRANADKARLVAVSDVNLAGAKALAEEYGGEVSVYASYEELLADANVDAVHVCSPNDTHAPISIQAMRAGKHVLCEKPMAATAAQAEEMLRVSRETGMTLSISYQNRFRDDSQAIYRACREGLLGEIYYARAHALRRKVVPTWGVFLDKSRQSGGPLIDIGGHALDLALWFMDNYDVASVTGSVFHKLADHPEANVYGPWEPSKFTVEDSAFGFIRMRDGATVYLESAWAINMRKPREAMTTLCGTLGGAEQFEGEFGPGSYSYNINLPMLGRLMTITPDAPCHYSNRVPRRENELMREAPAAEFAAWFDALKNGDKPVVRPEQALTVMRVLEAIYASAEQGKTIYFSQQ